MLRACYDETAPVKFRLNILCFLILFLANLIYGSIEKKVKRKTNVLLTPQIAIKLRTLLMALGHVRQRHRRLADPQLASNQLMHQLMNDSYLEYNWTCS